MKRVFFTIFLLLTIITFGANEPFKIMFSNDYPPYNHVNENGELVGFNIDILKAINELYDAEIEITGGSWKLVNEALEDGEIQAIGGAHYPGGSDINYIYTRSSISTSHCFLYNSEHVNNFSIEFLRSARDPVVAMWNNDVLIHYVHSINPSARFLHVKTYRELVNALDGENITCAFGQRIGSIYVANKLGKNYIRPLEHRILERNMGFKVAKESPELATLLNNGLEVILANGEYQRIYDKWITEYNKNQFSWKEHLKFILFIGLIIIVLFLLLLVANRFLKMQVRKKTRDLTQQLELNSQMMKELEKQKQRAEESDKMKSAFLANMSHEIRTPMNGILGFAELLESADFSQEEQARFIGIIQRSGNRMLETINNIIDVSKLEAGQDNMHIRQVSIKSILNELINFFSSEANNKSLKLTLVDNQSTYDEAFFTDEYKLNSILTNLVKNAIKFTSEGYVEIKYTISENQAKFWVKDTGIGIKRDKQKAIFNHFVQADVSRTSGVEGSGLGLSISEGYVKLLKGNIHLESEPGSGSTFYVCIPNNEKEKLDTKSSKQTVSSV